MKTLVMSLLVLSPALSFAATGSASARPAKVVCDIVGATSVLPKSVTVTKLNTDRPESTFEDAELMDPVDEKAVKDSGLVGVAFSNECDNSYSIEFFQPSLELLKSGKIKEITGYVYGGSSDGEPSAGTLRCRLK